MRAVEWIAAKRDGGELSRDQIDGFITAYTRGDMPDYQAAALLMAIYLRGMSRRETADLTLAMASSGDMLDLSDLHDYVVDKHSSGGVGDKTTLIVLPMVAACGVRIAKMSGRGLGYSGGTLDKLEAFAGYRVDLSADEFREMARTQPIVLAGQSLALAPADGKLYALRDVTGTVASLPLIASSIMSKKIAAGANGIVLDVKYGRGAFMSTLEDARALAETMAQIGADAGREVICALSDMNQPLGEAVGNALEVVEAIQTLQGGGPDDLREHCMTIAAYMLRLAGRGVKWRDDDEARADLQAKIDDGSALEMLRGMVAAHGGDMRAIDEVSRLPQAALIGTLFAPRGGFISGAHADTVALAAFELGAGREKKGDAIDLAVGVRVYPKVGDPVEVGAPLATLYANDGARLERARAILETAFTFSDEAVTPLPLFSGTIRSGG